MGAYRLTQRRLHFKAGREILRGRTVRSRNEVSDRWNLHQRGFREGRTLPEVVVQKVQLFQNLGFGKRQHSQTRGSGRHSISSIEFRGGRTCPGQDCRKLQPSQKFFYEKTHTAHGNAHDWGFWYFAQTWASACSAMGRSRGAIFSNFLDKSFASSATFFQFAALKVKFLREKRSSSRPRAASSCCPVPLSGVILGAPSHLEQNLWSVFLLTVPEFLEEVQRADQEAIHLAVQFR